MKRNNRFNRIVLMTCIAALFGSNVFLCGIGGFFDPPAVVMDTEKNIVYQNVAADDIIKAFVTDDDAAEDKYDDNYYAIHGTIESKSENNKEVILGKTDGKNEPVTCSTSDQTVIKSVEALTVGSKVIVYGQFSVGLFGGLNVDIHEITKDNNKSTSDTCFSLKSGTTEDKTSMKRRTFEDTDINFYIPSQWVPCEHNIQKEKLGTITGFQYKLNEIEPKNAYAESLFICYFDKESMVDLNDQDKNDEIEKAIIRDILEKDNLKSFPLKKVSTYYGPIYKYYRDTYTKAEIDKYQIEFIFQETDEGIIVFLYIYNDPVHIDDVMLTLRFLGNN